MIHYIVGEDNKRINQTIGQVIDKVMLQNNLAYQKMMFLDYNTKFISCIEQNLSNKIYILDIETPSSTGIEMARKIRQKDINSIIIFLTAYKEKYQETILSSEFMFFAFISKMDDYEQILYEKLTKALSYTFKKNAIRFTDQGVLYTIPTEDILYVTTDTQARKTLLITDYTTFKVNKTLQEVSLLLDEAFVQTHRACILNKNRVIEMDMKNRKIIFDNGTSIDLLSREYKKKLKEELKMDLVHSN